jgi:electron transport complex protein RnfB
MLEAVLLIGAIGLVLGVAIGIANKYLEVKSRPLVEAIYNELPHFNCGACGNPGCLAMANTVVDENAPLTNCKPGDAEMRRTIQTILDDYKSGKLVFEDDPMKK